MLKRLLQFSGLLLLALAFAGCEEEAAPKKDPAPSVVSFLASPESVEIGQPTVLSWKVENANWMRIEVVGGGEVALGNPRATEGSVEVTPEISTSYVLTAKGVGGETTATASVTVVPLPGAPVVVAFEADVEQIALGSTSTLSWTTTGADSVVVKDQLGNLLDLGGAAPSGGSLQVSPRGDMVYTLIATSRGGSTTAQASVGVVSAPKVSFAGPTTPVQPGAMGRLSWSVADASSVAIVDERGETVHQSSTEFTGTLDVAADYTSRFVLTAAGTGGETSAMAQVAVMPVIDRFEITTPGPVRPGDEVELAWSTRGATHAIVSQPGLTIATLEDPQASSGTVRARVGVDGSFLLAARSGSLEAIRSATIPLSQLPNIASFTVDRQQVTARNDLPATVTLSWKIDGAQRILIEQSTGGFVSTVGTSARGDSVDVQLIEDTTYTLTAINDYGQRVSAAAVDVLPAARILAFDARPLRVGSGDDVHLSWETQDAVAIRIERDGLDVTDDANLVNGSQTDALVADGIYVLKAIDVLGIEQTSEPFAITVGAPIVTSFTVDRPTIAAGTNLTFSWENLGGTSLEIQDEEGQTLTGCSTTSLYEIPDGSCVFQVPMVDDTITYTLRVSNDAGQTTTQPIDVVIVGGPVIQSFTASRTTASATDVVTFTWAVDDDAQGNQPRLVLTDDIGNTYAEVQADGIDTNAGSADVTLPAAAAGATSFTLRAETDGTTPSLRSAPVAVFGIPTVEALAATPDDLDTQNGTVPVNSTIAWTTTYGASLSLYRLDASGNWILPPVYATSDSASITSGGTVVAPTAGIHNYELDVVNGAGRHTEAGVTVYVDVAKTTLTADETDIIKGEDVTLTYGSRYASSVAITPASPVSVEEISATFEDVSSSGAAVTLTSSNDSGYGTITFPAGFTFPYFGTTYSAIQVSTDGWAGFNTANTSTNYTNVAMPVSGSAYIHLTPFWDDLNRNSGSAIYWEKKSDSNGDYLVIQWKAIEFFTSTDKPSSLNFEVILRPSGAIEYRYGSMTGVNLARTDGGSATIGLQNTAGTVGVTRLLDTAIPGGISNRAFTFRFAQPLSGTWTVAPRVDTTYAVNSINAYSNESKSVAIKVYPAAGVGNLTFSTNEPETNTPFVLNWATSNATSVVINDASGATLCSYTNTNSGACSITETATGSYTYTVIATGGITRNSATKTATVQVYNPMRIASFGASPSLILPGQSSTITWQTVGASTIALTANGQPVDLTGKSMVSDSLSLSPTVNTTYQLTITDSGRTRTASSTVAVRNAQVGSLSASSAQLPPGGGSTTVSWNTTGGTGVWFSGSTTAATAAEVTDGTGAFIDLSGRSTATTVAMSGSTAMGRIDFPAGFQFPFAGRMTTYARASSAGYLTFNPNASSSSSNAALPSWVSADPHLMPFWDSLTTQTGSALLYELFTNADGSRYLVIQWKGWTFNNSSYVPADLNFEVVLFDNGTFEYRYGTMSNNPSSQTTTNLGQVRGLGATIGYQDLGGLSRQFSHNAEVLPSLANRSWRYDPSAVASGSASVSPTQTTPYKVCAYSKGYVECQEITVVVPRAGDVMITEVMANVGSGRTDPDGEWFEVRNTTPWPIDVNGWVIGGSTSDTAHTINNGGPLVIPGGGFQVFSRAGSSANGIPGTYVYGTGIGLDHTATDMITLTSGTTEMDRVAWDSAWTFPAGSSLAVDPSWMRRDATKNDPVANWCTSAAAYDGSSLGSPGAVGTGCRFTTYDMDTASNAAFIDISSSSAATELTSLNADSGYGQLSGGIGFTFPFFTSTYSDMWITSNGVVTFTSISDSRTTNYTMPSSSGPTTAVAAYWDDLDAAAGSSVRTELRTVGLRQVRIVQWTNFKRYNSSGRGVATFQVQLWSDGEIVTANKEMRAVVGDATNTGYYTGSSATFGLQGSSTAGVLYSFDTAGATHSGHVIRYVKK